MKPKLIILTLIFIVFITIVGCSSDSRTHPGSKTITNSYRFDLVNWEIKAISSEIWQSITIHESPDSSDIVVAYFNSVQSGKTTIDDGTSLTKLRPRVEKIIQQQIRKVISDLGINNPSNNIMGIHFPPFSFILDKPPELLVTSSRNKIEILKEVRLRPDLTIAEMESIESEAEKMGESAVVLRLGGIGTFPAFVNNDATLSEALNDAAHEWMHQYLAFKPLGFRYVLDLLGISPNYDIVTINETVAGIFGDELEALVYDKYYSTFQTQLANPPSSDAPVFDFNATMRNIRLTVDVLLKQGLIDQAEQYMESQRQFLQTKGYNIRKLNQAYFAFNGAYGSAPTSVNPIGIKIKEIRNEYASIKGFLDVISSVTDLHQLNALK